MLTIFPYPAGMSLTKLSLAGNNLIIPDHGEFGISDIPAGDGKIANLFLQCAWTYVWPDRWAWSPSRWAWCRPLRCRRPPWCWCSTRCSSTPPVDVILQINFSIDWGKGGCLVVLNPEVARSLILRVQMLPYGEMLFTAPNSTLSFIYSTIL